MVRTPLSPSKELSACITCVLVHTVISASVPLFTHSQNSAQRISLSSEESMKSIPCSLAVSAVISLPFHAEKNIFAGLSTTSSCSINEEFLVLTTLSSDRPQAEKRVRNIAADNAPQIIFLCNFLPPLLLYYKGNASQGTPLNLIISHFVDSVNMYFNQISKRLFGYNVKISV